MKTYHHPDDQPIFDLMCKVAWDAASHFNLPLKTVEAKRRPATMSALGLCYVEEKRMVATIRYKDNQCDGGKWWNKPLPLDHILNTIAHELCHLLYYSHNCTEFRQLEIKVWEYIKTKYCPKSKLNAWMTYIKQRKK